VFELPKLCPGLFGTLDRTYWTICKPCTIRSLSTNGKTSFGVLQDNSAWRCQTMNQLRLFQLQKTVTHKVDRVREDILAQSANRPLRPVTEKLRRWVQESCEYYNAKVECNSFSHEHAREIRKTWLDLLLEAHDAGVKDTPLTLLGQAAAQYTKPWIKNHEDQRH